MVVFWALFARMTFPIFVFHFLSDAELTPSMTDIKEIENIFRVSVEL